MAKYNLWKQQIRPTIPALKTIGPGYPAGCLLNIETNDGMNLVEARSV